MACSAGGATLATTCSQTSSLGTGGRLLEVSRRGQNYVQSLTNLHTAVDNPERIATQMSSSKGRAKSSQNTSKGPKKNQDDSGQSTTYDSTTRPPSPTPGPSNVVQSRDATPAVPQRLPSPPPVQERQNTPEDAIVISDEDDEPEPVDTPFISRKVDPAIVSEYMAFGRSLDTMDKSVWMRMRTKMDAFYGDGGGSSAQVSAAVAAKAEKQPAPAAETGSGKDSAGGDPDPHSAEGGNSTGGTSSSLPPEIGTNAFAPRYCASPTGRLFNS